MGDLKKTFLAGFAVLIILLFAPYYLEFIGYNVSSEEVVAEETILPSENNQKTQPITAEPMVVQSSNLSKQPTNVHAIQTPLYSVVVSNVGGGSIQKLSLASQQQFIGGYVSDGNYQKTEGAELVSNTGGCAPCVGYYDLNNQPHVLNNADWKTHNSSHSISLENSPIILSVENIFSVEYFYQLSKTTTIFKKTILNGENFVSNHEIYIQSSDNSIKKVFLFWDKGINNTEQNVYDELTYASASFSVNQEIETISFSPDDINDTFDDAMGKSGSVDWASIRNKYFIAAFIPNNASSVKIDATASILNNNTVPVYSALLSSETSSELACRLFLGPLDIDQINALDTTLDRIMNFGWFIIQPFSRGVLWLLKLLHSTGLNYGVILILFAFIVRIITGPLTKKAFVSSQQMQAVQPKLKKLQEKYKNDSKKLNQEMIKLYRDNNVNPAGGCFPMLLQMPLLFSLFLVFRSTIEFRGAPFFGWISNLSQPDTIFYLPFHIPIYGDQVAFLPILLGISMFLTQKMSMANMDSQQKPMMYIMSAFFFLIFNSFPSGLNLYYLIYNILNYFQQRSLKKA